MTHEYILEVQVKNTPIIKKKCNRCGNSRFYCSDKFRMNAQKKSLDIWLIYKCSACDSTYNATILSRTKPENINKDLLTMFMENDIRTAWKYAFSIELAKINHMEVDYTSVQYDLITDAPSMAKLLTYSSDQVVLKIQYPIDFNLKVATLIKKALNLSTNQLTKLIDDGMFTIDSKLLQKKDKARNGQLVKINMQMVRALSNM
ncbi:DUF1062 domain-containing protein [Sphingobacterium lactis]|uniref:DUF1062 domain-containing protein n=1 Tax=Sphingobacterium lactis TaxID=797291 RepID=UPI003DA1E800